MRTGFRFMVSIVVLPLAGAVFAGHAQAQRPEHPQHPQQQHGRKHAQPQHARPQHPQPQHARPRRAQPQRVSRPQPVRPARTPARHARAEHPRPTRSVPARAARPTPVRRAPVTGAARQRRVVEARARRDAYRGTLSREIVAGRERVARLRAEHRRARYQAEEQYLSRLREQESRMPRAYGSYARVLAPPVYRYRRGGEYYETSTYGADMLRRAVRYGYEEGYRIGRADRVDRAPFGYRDSYAYQDANYGYEGLYVPEDAYNYYFRQGFQRGYEDGYYSRQQFGTFIGGVPTILGGVLAGIVALSLIH